VIASRKLKYRGLLRALRGSDAGQALVETALSMSLLVPLLIGAAEFARAAYASIEVSNAARAAVQYGAQNGVTAADTTGMQTAATNDAPNIALGTTTVSTSYICSDGTASTGLNTDCANSHIEEILTVTTTTSFDPLIYLPGIPKTFTLTGRAVQKCAQ
jgi:Flp pilus assembly protein TadG